MNVMQYLLISSVLVKQDIWSIKEINKLYSFSMLKFIRVFVFSTIICYMYCKESEVYWHRQAMAIKINITASKLKKLRQRYCTFFQFLAFVARRHCTHLRKLIADSFTRIFNERICFKEGLQCTQP